MPSYSDFFLGSTMKHYIWPIMPASDSFIYVRRYFGHRSCMVLVPVVFHMLIDRSCTRGKLSLMNFAGHVRTLQKQTDRSLSCSISRPHGDGTKPRARISRSAAKTQRHGPQEKQRCSE
jgi:hypothetical protein